MIRKLMYIINGDFVYDLVDWFMARRREEECEEEYDPGREADWAEIIYGPER